MSDPDRRTYWPSLGSDQPAMSDQTIWYSIDGHIERHSLKVDARELTLGVNEESDMSRAEEAAEAYFDLQGGRDNQWPKTIFLYATEDGPAERTFKVRMDWSPNFYASEAAKQETNA